MPDTILGAGIYHAPRFLCEAEKDRQREAQKAMQKRKQQTAASDSTAATSSDEKYVDEDNDDDDVFSRIAKDDLKAQQRTSGVAGVVGSAPVVEEEPFNFEEEYFQVYPRGTRVCVSLLLSSSLPLCRRS